MTHRFIHFFTVNILLATLFLTGCSVPKQEQPRIGETVAWSGLSGWNADNHQKVWPALLNNCIVLAKTKQWQPICDAAQALKQPSTTQVKVFFQQWFTPHRIYDANGNDKGLITGYYEPLLSGSLTQHGAYQYPIYRAPDNLLKVDMVALSPESKSKNTRGRLLANKIVPFYSREQINTDPSPLAGNEILWLDNRDDVFFLHVQGSGRVQLDDGRVIGVGYADHNGHDYVSIGKILKQRQQLKPEEISLSTIRGWLDNHPDQAEQLLNENPRYIFFSLRKNGDSNPVGSLNVPLTPQRSIAIDPNFIPLGTPIWLQTYYPKGYPNKANQPLQQLVIAQDTGAAIKGELRADLFWGHGERAEIAAGNMKSSGTMVALIPNQQPQNTLAP